MCVCEREREKEKEYQTKALHDSGTFASLDTTRFTKEKKVKPERHEQDSENHLVTGIADPKDAVGAALEGLELHRAARRQVKA